MKIVYYTHSLRSCWNHGNAHFLRGVLTEFASRGHAVLPCEPADNWSFGNMLQEKAVGALMPFEHYYPSLRCETYASLDEGAAMADGADLVIVHEWNDPALVTELGRRRQRGSTFRLLFHDTHHRAVSNPEAIAMFDLSGYDGILAFGETLARIYESWGWRGCVFVWHEAADTRLFYPRVTPATREGLIWIGNWGDGERSEELERFLLAPARDAGWTLDIHGVRYPEGALAMLRAYGARYHGWLPNVLTPEAFSSHLATVHVPRRFYTTRLPGIPTIRVFEALACGIPLVCAPWDDTEDLFTPGEDYLSARDGAEMARHLRAIAADPALRYALTKRGIETINARHSCAHRADELLAIAARLGVRAKLEPQI